MSPLRRPHTLRTATLASLVALSACGAPPAAQSDPPPAPTGSAATAWASGSASPTKGVALAVAPAASAAPFNDGARAFAAVKDALLSHYDGVPVSEDELYRAAVEGMLEHVDGKRASWNKLLSPDEVRALREDLNGELVGIGVLIEFDSATGYADVQTVFSASPAEHAGLLAGDKILDVDGRLFKGMHEQDVVNRIRGKAGTTVNLAVLRDDKVLNVPIVRQVVNYAVVTGGMLPDRSGYLRIKSFNAKTPAGVQTTLAELDKDKARALVVDLRSNPGGAFDDAVSTAELLLPTGAGIVKLVKKGEAPKTFNVQKGATVLANVPMIVLVNQETASGGEFLAAALRDGRKAEIIGQKTFGKWTVQTLDDLPNGYAVKYTTSLFQTAKGETFDGVGLAPDVEVDLDAKGMMACEREKDLSERVKLDAQLRAAMGLLKER